MQIMQIIWFKFCRNSINPVGNNILPKQFNDAQIDASLHRMLTEMLKFMLYTALVQIQCAWSNPVYFMNTSSQITFWFTWNKQMYSK